MELASTSKAALRLVAALALLTSAGLPIGSARACAGNPSGPPAVPPPVETCAVWHKPPASPGTPAPAPGAGNPINLITGNKYQEEVDLPAMPGDLGIELVRHYNSAQRGELGLAGAGWKFSYETRLHIFTDSLQIVTADGARFLFDRDPKNPGLCTSADPAAGRLEVIKRSSGAEEYLWTWGGAASQDGRRLRFDANGLLESIESGEGRLVTLFYGPGGELSRVTDPFGRSLQFHYASPRIPGFKGVVSVDTPVGRFDYFHDDEGKSPGLSNLVRVAYPQIPGKPVVERVYHYGWEAAERKWGQGLGHALTGITVRAIGSDGKVASASRISTYGYDQQGRAVMTVRGRPRELDAKGVIVAGTGTDQEEVSYDAPPEKGEGSEAGALQPVFRTVLTNALGKRTVYRSIIVASEWRLLESRGPGCTTCPETNVRFRYDARGRMVARIALDAEGRPVQERTMDLDGLGRVVRAWRREFQAGMPVGTPILVASYAYQGAGTLPVEVSRPSVVPGREHTVHIDYDERGRPVRVRERGFSPVDEQGGDATARLERTSTFRYDASGRLEQVEGSLAGSAERVRLLYDAMGRVARVEQPLAQVVQYDYDALSRIVRVTMPGGIQAELGYDALGRAERMAAGGAELHVGYDDLGQATEMRSKSGDRFGFTYDAAGRVTGISDGSGSRINLDRDAEGRLVGKQLLDADGAVSRAEVVEEKSAPGDGVTLGGAREESRLDANGGVWKLAFDAQGLPRSFSDPHHAVTRLARDAWDRVTRVTDGRNVATGYDYDDFGRLVRISSPDAGINRYVFDDHDRLLLRRTARGDALRYHYDQAGRLTELATPEGSTQVVYNAIGKPAELHFPGGQERFAFDTLGRLVEHVLSIDGRNETTSYTYNDLGQLASMSLPDGNELLYRYRGSVHPRAGSVMAILRKGRLLDETIIEGLNEAGERHADRDWRFGNGLRSHQHVDARGRLVSEGTPDVWGSDQSEIVTRLDASGRLAAYQPLRETEGFAEGFSYDDSGNLAHRAVYRYGAAGPLLPGSYTDDAQYEKGSNRLLRVQRLREVESAPETIEYTYDAAGQPTRIGRRELQWDSLGRLVEVREAGADGHPRVVARYAYNAFGQRIRKLVFDPSNPSKEPRATYFVHEGGRLIAESGASGWSTYAWIDDRVVGMLRGRSTFFVHSDARGAPQAVTDEGRRVVWRSQTQAFEGAQVQVSGADPFTLNLRASNQYFDEESGWHYNMARYFDPETGRYLSPDPLGQAGGANVYQFARSNPLDFTDPLGLATVPTSPYQINLVGLPANANVATMSFGDKLSVVFQSALPLFPAKLQSEIQKLISNLPTIVLVMATFVAAQGIPFVGAGLDFLVAGVAWVQFGASAIDLVKDVYLLIKDINNATCPANLQQATWDFYNSINDLVNSVLAGLGAGAAQDAAASRVSDILDSLFFDARNSEKAVATLPASPTKLTAAETDAAVIDAAAVDELEATDAANAAATPVVAGRPTWRQSELDVGKFLGMGWQEQLQFLGKKLLPKGPPWVKGSVRPDWCNLSLKICVEVKNYSLSNIANLIKVTSAQLIVRAQELPAGFVQKLIVDLRGQGSTAAQRQQIINGIIANSNGAITRSNITIWF